ncbi:MAG: alanine racemase [Syntrophomonadaceae bacterium]|nr:alanine racemase [Syntrophomonadaceae bacterium]
MVPNLPDKWVEINLDAVGKNLQTVKSLLAEGTRLIAVIKADAYGHGAAVTAQLLRDNGVEYFAVSFFREAMQLRQAGIAENILVFSPIISEYELREAIKYNLTITIASLFDWQLLDNVSASVDAEIKIHLKVDTGLGRFGLQAKEVLGLIPKIRKNCRINIEGIYTHMAAAASSPAYTRGQFRSFMQILHQLEEAGLKISLRHCANSAVLLKYPQMQLDAVRIGTLLSGQAPVGIARPDLVLEDPYHFKTRIVSLRKLEKGSYLAYYRSYRLKKAAQVAVIPVGFIDGLALQVGNKPSGWLDLLKTIVKIILLYGNVARFGPQVSIKGIDYPVRGKVFMQMALVEIPPDREVNIGDEVTVPVRKTLTSPDITRIYLHHGKVVKISTKEGGMDSPVELLSIED